jgi:hypothetical protein
MFPRFIRIKDCWGRWSDGQEIPDHAAAAVFACLQVVSVGGVPYEISASCLLPQLAPSGSRRASSVCGGRLPVKHRFTSVAEKLHHLSRRSPPPNLARTCSMTGAMCGGASQSPVRGMRCRRSGRKLQLLRRNGRDRTLNRKIILVAPRSAGLLSPGECWAPTRGWPGCP